LPQCDNIIFIIVSIGLDWQHLEPWTSESGGSGLSEHYLVSYTISSAATNTGSVVVNDVHNLKRQNMNATQTTTITTTQSYYYTYQNNNNAETYGPTFQLYHYNGLRGGALKPFHVVTRLSADKAIGASISLGVASNQATTTGDLKMSFAPSGHLAKSIGWGRYHRVFTRLLIVEQMQNK
jgi:hypothetical protein